MPLFDCLELPFCKVIRVGAWNAEAHRYFLAYHTIGSFRHVMGLAVNDEYATFSTPIFLAPIPLLGKIYNAGISLAYKRGSDMELDSGWPPVCVGTEESAPELPDLWEQQLLNAIMSDEAGRFGTDVNVAGYETRYLQIANLSIFASEAPLLPKQLKRICQIGKSPINIAFSTGNKISRVTNSALLDISVASEAMVDEISSKLAKII